jgi:hypothetical protein
MTENLIRAKALAMAVKGDAWATMSHRDRLYAIQDQLPVVQAEARR